MRKLITCLPLLFGLGVVLSAQDRVAISGFVAAGMASPADGLSTAPSSDQLEIDMWKTLDHRCSEGVRDATARTVSGEILMWFDLKLRR